MKSSYTRVSGKATPHQQLNPPHAAVNVSGNASAISANNDEAIKVLRNRLAEAFGQMQNTGWLVELLQTLAATDRFATACHELTAQLQSQLNVVRVVLGWNGSGNTQRVMSISGIANPDRYTDEVRLYQSCLDEAITRDALGIYPQPNEPSDSMLSHKQVAGQDREVVSSPLVTKNGKTVGSLLIIAARGQITTQPNTTAFLSAATSPLADVMAACHRGEGTRLTRAVRWYRSASAVRRGVAAACVVGLFAAAWIPVHYQVAASTIIQPVERRYCVAPHDGLLEQTRVEPGDVVERNQPIATLDGREIRLELAGLVAEYRRAAKQHDAHLAAHHTTEAMQSELEMQRLQSQIDLLRHRESNLTMVAPIQGIVLSGSMDRRENFPVNQGDVLFEIAPLDALRIELSVSCDDVSYIKEGTSVEMMFAGFGSETFTATVTKICPQSEIRDEQNVFIAQCVLQNDDGRLRPGMKGHAKIQGEKHSIGWIALHRAWEQLCVRVPW